MPAGNTIRITLDAAISIDRALRAGEIARLFRDGLVLVTGDIPSALGEVVPSDAVPQQAEVHVLAPASDGQNRQRNANNLLDRIDLSQFGERTRDVGPSLGCAVRVSAPLAEREGAEIIAEACNRMLLDAGYLDPRIGMSQLRGELGLGTAV